MDRHLNFDSGDHVLVDGVEHVFDGCVSSTGPDQPDGLVFLDRRIGRRTTFTMPEFDYAYSEGRFRFVKAYERVADKAPETDAPDHGIALRRRLWCEAFDADPVPKSDAKLRAFIEITTPTIEGPAPSPGALRRWLQHRGSTHDRRPRFMGNRGRRGPRGMNIDPIVQDILFEKLGDYASGVATNQKAVYAAARTAVCAVNVERAHDGLPLLTPASPATVHRFIRRHEDQRVSESRYGKRVGSKPFVPIKGSMDAKHILDIAIIDHTPLDCFVIDNEHLINVGRPYLTVAMDAYSRSVLSAVLSFEPPSVYTAMACLRQMVRPKLDITEDFPEIRGDWVAFGVPDTIVVDNAWEFTQSSFADACADAGISITWAGIADPQYKGIGERFFRTLNDMLVHRLPGGLPFTPQRRKELGIDGLDRAVLTMTDVRALIYQCIIEVYSKARHRMLGAAPEDVWKRQAKVRGTTYAPDISAMDMGLTRLSSDRVLTREGIQLHNLTYRAPEALAGLLADLVPNAPRRNAPRTGVQVKVKFEPHDLGRVLVYNPVRRTYVPLPCTQPRYADGLSLHHHEVVSKFARDEDLRFQSEDDRCAARERLQQSIRAKIPASNIGERRRLQRLKQEGAQAVSAVRVSEVADVTGDMIPVATTANRQAGEIASRRQSRPARRSAASSRKPKSNETVATKVVMKSEPDAYGDIDFAALQEQAMHGGRL